MRVRAPHGRHRPARRGPSRPRPPVPRAGGLAVAVAFVGVGAVAVLLIASSTPSGPFPRPTSGAATRSAAASSLALLGGVAARGSVRLHRRPLADPGALAVHPPARPRRSGHRPGRRHHASSTTRSTSSAACSAPATIRFGELAPLTPAAIVVTILWIVGMINSINFIDGLDGLSTGVVAHRRRDARHHLAHRGRLVPADGRAPLRGPRRSAGRVPALELPSGPGLHRHDRRLWPSGYALAVLSILGTAKVAVALLVLGVPIIDTFWIITRRLAARQLALRARPRPHPPPAAGPGPDPPRRRAAHLCHLHAAGGREHRCSAGVRAAVRVHGHRRGLGLRAATCVTRRAGGERRARGRLVPED